MVNIRGSRGTKKYIFGRRDLKRSQHTKLNHLRAHKTPIMENRDAVIRVINRRVQYLGWSGNTLSRETGLNRGACFRFLNGKHNNHTTGTFQLFCDQLGIRFNHLAYTGPIFEHDQVVEILDDLNRRIETLELDPHSIEFINYCGYNYGSLVQEIRDSGISNRIHKLLTNKFHMRLAPFKGKKLKAIHKLNVTKALKSMREWLDKRELSFVDLAKACGSDKNLVGLFFNKGSITSPSAALILDFFGYEYRQLSLAELEPYPQVCLYDESLGHAIRHQLSELGWSHRDFENKTGIPFHRIAKILASLEKPIEDKTEASPPSSYMDQICRLLKIQCYDLDTVPRIKIPNGTCLEEIISIYLPLLVKRRFQLGIVNKEFAQLIQEKYGIHCHYHTIVAILDGNITLKNREIFEYMLKLLGFDHEPFSVHLQRVIETKLSGPVLRKYLEPVTQGQLISYQRTGRIIGYEKRIVQLIVTGRRSAQSVETLRVCRLYNVILPGDTHLIEFIEMDSLRQRRGLSVQELCAQVEITELDYYQLKCGIHSLDSEIANKIKDHLDSMTWAQEIQRRLNQTGQTQNIIDELGYDALTIAAVTSQRTPLFSDEVIDLAIHYNLFDEALSQHVLELCHDEPELIQSLNLIPATGLIRDPVEFEKVIHIRKRLLLLQLKGQPLNTNQLQVLTQSGGDLDSLAELSKWQIFYRYSIGDVATAYLAWRIKNKTQSEFETEYAQWLRQNYGLELNHHIQKVKIPGKYFKVDTGIHSFQYFYRNNLSVITDNDLAAR